jgi:hypothetical protein
MNDTTSPPAGPEAPSAWIRRLYPPTLGIMALTGFGQMPIYKRYYASDLPGLGWLADFYVTRNVHYIGAAVLLALLCYAAADFLLLRRGRARLSPSGWLRGALLAAVAVSGVFIVVKNFPYVHFSDRFIIGLNLFHIGAVMALLASSLAFRVMKKKWTAPA